jgi:SAM-dependent methyltransferase
MSNGGTGRGAFAPDGSAVEFYKSLQHLGEADIVHSAVPAGAEILELGCGVGRITRPLRELGHPVVAVDESPEMLAEVQDAETMCADIATLRLGRRFPGVLLMSCLVNVADADLRHAFLETCAAHVEPRGVVVLQCHDPGLADRAKPGPVGADPNGIRFAWREVERDGPFVRGTLEYAFRGDVWTQRLNLRVFDETGLKSELEGAGLRFDRWLKEPHWFTARLQ